MPAFFPEGDDPLSTDPSNKSLQKINSLLKSIDTKTGSTTITGPVTVNNEVEVKNDSNNPLPVSDNGGSLTVDGSVSVSNFPATQPVSGTVTANAGTDLNTSALALETTATAIKTAVETLDNAIAGNEMQVDIVSGTVTADGGDFTGIQFQAQPPARGIQLGYYDTANSEWVNISQDGLPIQAINPLTVQGNLELPTVTRANNDNNAQGALNIGYNTEDNEFRQVSDTQPLPVRAELADVTALVGDPPPTSLVAIGGINQSDGALNTIQVYSHLDTIDGQVLGIKGEVSLANIPIISGGNAGNGQLPVQDENSGNTAQKGVPIAWNDNEAPDSRVAGTTYPLPVQVLNTPTVTANGGDFTGLDEGALPAKLVAVAGYDYVNGELNPIPIYAFGESVNGNAVGIKGEVSGTVTANVQSNFENSDGDAPPSNAVAIGFVEQGGDFKFVTEGSRPLPISGTVTDRGATGMATVATFTSTSSAEIRASEAGRKLLTIYNEGNGDLHVLYGNGTASTTNYTVKILPGDFLEIEKYTGRVMGIFASSGTARVTEIT